MTGDERSKPLLERYTFMAMTTCDLSRARAFWVDQLLCPVLEEEPGEYFIVDAGGLKLCVDVNAKSRGEIGPDPVIAFKVLALRDAIASLRARGVSIVKVDFSDRGRPWAELSDPDGHTIVLTEGD